MQGTVLDGIMFTLVLLACSHSQFMFEGLECFKTPNRDLRITAGLIHNTTLTDIMEHARDF